MTSHTKDKILTGAARLFFSEGFSTGIDRVVSECGVAKMTLYQHFKSKDGLICAILHEVQSFILNHIRIETARNAKPPAAQLEAIARILCEAMTDPEAKAGLAVRALAEFPDPRNPVHAKARHVDLEILNILEPRCTEASLPNARQAARQILQIAKGHFLMAPTLGIETSRTLSFELLDVLLAAASDSLATQ
jgi:AcrR family transcriptional regulator